jgi:transcriptional regulator with XRE-family HTH domain
MNVSEKLKLARTDFGLTQESVAEKVNVSRQTIYNWENGKSYPDIASLIALSDVYGVTLDSFVKGDKGMIRHLEESSGGGGKVRYVAISIVALASVLFGIWFSIFAIGADVRLFLDFPSLFFLFIPMLYVLTITRGFRLFYLGLRAVFFPKKGISDEHREQSASLFRLMSKTTAITAAIGATIGFISMGVDLGRRLGENLESSLEPLEFLLYFFANISVNILMPLYALIMILVIFEPVVFILKRK